jgi:hypothetical protein
MGYHLYDPFFKINFYPPKLWRSVSFSFLAGFEQVKRPWVCFLVNYILSWDHNWKRGRLSETEVTETLCVQPPACLPYLLTLQETWASSLPRVIMGLAATSHSDLYIKICICLFECGKVVGTSNQCWAGTWFGGLESQGSVQVSENQIGIRYDFCNQNQGCGFSKTGTKPKLRYWLYKNQNWIVIQDFWKEGLELGVNCRFWSRLVRTRTGFWRTKPKLELL